MKSTAAALGLVVFALRLGVSASAAPLAPSAAACVAAHRAATTGEGAAQLHADDAAFIARDHEPALDDATTKALAAEVFTRCAVRTFGPAAAPRAAACEADLYTLPVMLLYRADGQTRKQAQADLNRPGNEADTLADARRSAAMLAFAYQGAGPAGEGASAWIAKRTDEWTSACLRGQR